MAVFSTDRRKSHRGEYFRHLGAHVLGLLASPGHGDQKVVRIRKSR